MEVPVRVLIADDRARSRNGLKALLLTRPDVTVVGEAANGREVMRLVAECRPNVVVIDARMPTMDGLAATRMIKANWPEIRVVVLTMYSSHRADALASGADTFLVKGCSADVLLRGIVAGEEEPR